MSNHVHVPDQLPQLLGASTPQSPPTGIDFLLVGATIRYRAALEAGEYPGPEHEYSE